MESASDKLSDENTSHVVMVLNNTTNAISFIGDNISVEAFLKKKELIKTMEDTMKEAKHESKKNKENNKHKMTSKLKLFANPNTKEWKGTVKIGTQCSQVLSRHGFGHNKGPKFGKGPPPPGWPLLYNWETFKGPSRHSDAMNTEIILSLLEEENGEDADETEVNKGEAVKEENENDHYSKEGKTPTKEIDIGSDKEEEKPKEMEENKSNSDTEESVSDASDTEEEQMQPAKKAKTWEERNIQLKKQIDTENITNQALIRRQKNIDELTNQRLKVYSSSNKTYKCYCSKMFTSLSKRVAHLETSTICRQKDDDAVKNKSTV